MRDPRERSHHITFFFTDGVERQTLQPIAEEAQRRGFTIRFCDNIFQKAEIGFYCQHVCYPHNSALSVILLHDLAQGHNRWPNIWIREPWHKFDIGILPGNSWEERWQACSQDPLVHPRLGVFKLGWPKADMVFASQERFRQESEAMRKKLGLIHPRSILYAPSWENDGKQDEFVQALKSLPVNLLLKQAPFPASFTQILENIRVMNEKHRGCQDNVFIVDSDISIMKCLGLADIVVSEESSVMFEALLFDVPSLAVVDWMIPDRAPPRPPSIPFDFIRKTQKACLRQTVEEMLATLGAEKDRLQDRRSHHFSMLGKSSAGIISLLESVLAEGRPAFAPVRPVHEVLPLPLIRKAKIMIGSVHRLFHQLGRTFRRQS